MPADKIISFKSWVYLTRWWRYQRAHQDLIPYPLINVYPYQNPFLDPLQPPEEATPLVTRLFGTDLRFHAGQLLLCVTRANRGVLKELSRGFSKRYFAVAGLRVRRVWESHEAYAQTCRERQYVTAPSLTSAPPTVAVNPEMPNAMVREGCVVGDSDYGSDVYLGNHERAQYEFFLEGYHAKVKHGSQQLAECEFIQLGSGRYARALTPVQARLIGPEDWSPYIIPDRSRERIRFEDWAPWLDLAPGKASGLLEACFGTN